MEIVSIGELVKCFFDLISGRVKERKEQVYIPCRDKFIEIESKYFQNQSSNNDFENDLSDIEYKILNSDIKQEEKNRLQEKLNFMKNWKNFSAENKQYVYQMIVYFNYKIANCSITNHIKSFFISAIKGLIGFVFYASILILILHCMKIKITYFIGQNSVESIEFINDIPSLILFILTTIIILYISMRVYVKKHNKSIDDYWGNNS